MNTSEKIRYYRKQAGLTTKQLADIMGAKSGSYVSCYENGRRTPGRKTLQKFADALNINVLELEDDGIIENAGIFSNMQLHTPSTALSWVDIASDYSCLSEEDKDIICLAEKYTDVYNQLRYDEKKQLVNFCTSLLELETENRRNLLDFSQKYAAKAATLSKKETDIISVILED